MSVRTRTRRGEIDLRDRPLAGRSPKAATSTQQPSSGPGRRSASTRARLAIGGANRRPPGGSDRPRDSRRFGERFDLFGRRTAVIATVAAVTLVLVALPARSYLAQQSQVDVARAELASLEKDNDRLQAHKDRLSDPEEIARIARRDYGLVEVGQESYSVLPPSTAGLVMPQAWPFDRIEAGVRTAAGG